jgi:outer membrane receptor protein involved in Fe transport
LAENTVGEDAAQTYLSDIFTHNVAKTDTTTEQWAPRLGVVFKPTGQMTVRGAYQDWIRPLSVSTLNSVQTAGIPLEDRLVEAGGRMKRNVMQLGWTPSDSLFVTFKADRQDISNLTSRGVDLRTPALPFLDALRNAQTVNLTSVDVLEDTPSFEDGTVSAISVGINRLMTPNLSGYIKYIQQETTSAYEDSNSPTGRVTGKQIPYMPRTTAVLGATWTPGYHTYLSARAVYRSDRFEEKENLTLWPAGWTMDMVVFWETADKHWVIGLGALNLGGSKTPRQTERYVLDARYRF